MVTELPMAISSINKQTIVTLESSSPHQQLVRLQADFGFRIFCSQGYAMSTDDSLEQEPVVVTPCFKSLQELERHVDKNMVDILYSYLFTVPAEDFAETQQQA